MKFRLRSKGLVKVATLALFLSVLCLAALSCTGQAAQGWSGFARDDGMLYFGSIDGNVLALNISARSENLHFPSEGEWAIPVRAPSRGGSICGPACAPAAQPAAMYATPVIAGDLVCVATYAGDNGKVIAINRLTPGYRDGVPLRSKGEWVYPSETKSIGSIVGTPVLFEDVLYVGSSDGKVYALSVTYGENKWDFDTGGKIWTSPTVSDGVVYVSNYAKQLYAIKDGSELWHKDYSTAIASSPVVSGGKIFFGTFDNYLHAVNSSNGETMWTFLGGKWFWVPPVVQNGIVYAGCLDKRVYAIEATTGRELWSFEADSSIVSQPVFAGSQLIICSELGSLYAVDPNTGALVRSASVGKLVKAPIYVDGNRVYVHAMDKNVYCVDLQSGQIAWKFSSVIK